MTRLNREDLMGYTHELSVFLCGESCRETKINKFSFTDKGTMLFERDMSGDGLFIKRPNIDIIGDMMICVKGDDGRVILVWDAKECEVIKRQLSPIIIGVDDNWVESAEIRFKKCIEMYGKDAGDKWRNKIASKDVVEKDESTIEQERTGN